MKHYINQEANLLAQISKKVHLSIFVLSILLASAFTAKASTIENVKTLIEINSCKSIAVHYIENEKYFSGDSDLLYMNFSLSEQKSRAKQLVIDSQKSTIQNLKGNCNIRISYEL